MTFSYSSYILSTYNNESSPLTRIGLSSVNERVRRRKERKAVTKTERKRATSEQNR